MEERRDLRRRIRSVRSIQHITRAMSLAASTRLRRIERLVEPARAYASLVNGIVHDTAARIPRWAHPLLKTRETSTRACLVLTSDRGLAGAYNAEILREATRILGAVDPGGAHAAVLVVGGKGRDFFRRRGHPPIREYVQVPDTPDESLARRIATDLLTLYAEGETDSAYMVFARFVSRGSYEPHVTQLLPVRSHPRAAQGDGEPAPSAVRLNAKQEGAAVDRKTRGSVPRRDDAPDGSDLQYIYEPSPESMLDRLVPQYLASEVYAALVEAKASELAARTIAMDSATDSAGELIEALTLTYNRARQAEITQEISEIATGAESLR